MERIPVMFNYDGKDYIGELSPVQGAGSNAIYHLMIDGYYYGRLRLSAFDNTWVFDGQFQDMAEVFAIWILFFRWAVEEYRQDPQGLFCGMLESSNLLTAEAIDDLESFRL